MLNVFQRDGGTIRRSWGFKLMFAPSQRGRDPLHIDTIDLFWNLFNFTPDGRGADWRPRPSYS